MDLQELRERQSWTLRQKIDHSLGVIDQFVSRLNGQVYVGFSGGKDSTVLLDLCRIIKPDIKAVFCNTGNEYPDIVRFVRELKTQSGEILKSTWVRGYKSGQGFGSISQTHIIPFDKFDPNNIEESLKHNIVKP